MPWSSLPPELVDLIVKCVVALNDNQQTLHSCHQTSVVLCHYSRVWLFRSLSLPQSTKYAEHGRSLKKYFENAIEVLKPNLQGSTSCVNEGIAPHLKRVELLSCGNKNLKDDTPEMEAIAGAWSKFFRQEHDLAARFFDSIQGHGITDLRLDFGYNQDISSLSPRLLASLDRLLKSPRLASLQLRHVTLFPTDLLAGTTLRSLGVIAVHLSGSSPFIQVPSTVPLPILRKFHTNGVWFLDADQGAFLRTVCPNLKELKWSTQRVPPHIVGSELAAACAQTVERLELDILGLPGTGKDRFVASRAFLSHRFEKLRWLTLRFQINSFTVNFTEICRNINAIIRDLSFPLAVLELVAQEKTAFNTNPNRLGDWFQHVKALHPWGSLRSIIPRHTAFPFQLCLQIIFESLVDSQRFYRVPSNFAAFSENVARVIRKEASLTFLPPYNFVINVEFDKWSIANPLPVG